MEQTQQTPQGKGMGVAGFVISLVALVFYFIVSPIVLLQAALGGGYGLGIFWLLLALAGTGLSVMGMMKLGKTGGKRGLAITGMILGIIATILTVLLVIGIGSAQKAGDEFGDQFKEAMEQGMQQGFDSMAVEMEQAVDSATTQQ
jgi:hypothetical protein